MATPLLESFVSSQISEASTQPPAVQKLLLKKINYNIKVLRENGSPHSTILKFEDHLMDIGLQVYEQTKAPLSNAPKFSGNPQDEDLLTELNDLPTTTPQIRKRKTKLEVNQEVQTDLSEDLIQMVQKIRQNAELFHENLNADRSVVDSAADALQNASSSMGTVGVKLQNYRKTSALGWWFYIYAGLFIASAVIFGMLLIQLFPKF